MNGIEYGKSSVRYLLLLARGPLWYIGPETAG